ncbi:Cyclin-D3-3 [Camellia lanceoleosa]|uniref:Cyclin-D3-3 n=1 Tax=Camellia lanceoleosa TaxID=1840588 RepID=A0ACC0HGG8_9ERIC|nr:Cyclin-D3-3 [Camellia lanceoleosa]
MRTNVLNSDESLMVAMRESVEWILKVIAQGEESKFVFEAETIQKMDVLVLSTLQWKMNPVIPLSFVDHIVRRFGFKTDLHLEFL